MAIESVPGRVAILLVCNSPFIVGFGSIFFSSWGEFFKAFIPEFDFSFWSWVLDMHTYTSWENLKLFLFLILVGLALYGEYRFFWPNPPAPPPVQFISSLANGRPNLSLNPDPACNVLRSLSSSGFPGSVQRLGAGGAG